MTISGATTPNLSGLGSNGNEGIPCIPQNSRISVATLSDCILSYPWHLFGWVSNPSAESVYSTASADWVILVFVVVVVVVVVLSVVNKDTWYYITVLKSFSLNSKR